MEFKNTEIGRIPKEWEVVRLGKNHIAEIRGNKAIKGFKKVAFIPMEFVPDSGIYVKYELRPIEEVKSFTYCESGDLLLAKITPSLENGKQGIVPEDIPNGFALATTEVFPICCKSVEKLFLFYILKFSKYRNKIIFSMIGTTGRQRASKESVENLLIPLPPLPEQKKIAEILSTVDLAIEKVNKAIEKTERLKKGLMEELLTKGWRRKEEGEREFKDTEIGRIPKDWEVVRLGEVVTYIKGKKPAKMVEEYQENCLPYLSTEYLRDNKPTNYVFISSDVISVGEGDLLLLWDGSNAGEFFLGKKGVLSSTMVKFEIRENRYFPTFLFYLLKTKESHLKGQTKGTGIPHVDRNVLNSLHIPLPPLPEQKKIAEILSTVDRRLELLKKRKEKLERVKKGLMEDLLTGRKRVKLD